MQSTDLDRFYSVQCELLVSQLRGAGRRASRELCGWWKGNVGKKKNYGKSCLTDAISPTVHTFFGVGVVHNCYINWECLRSSLSAVQWP
jgi:hypothetical protein